MSYYCDVCKQRRDQGCFGTGCPGIPADYHSPEDALQKQVESLAEQLVQCRLQLQRYQERERTQGWAKL